MSGLRKSGVVTTLFSGGVFFGLHSSGGVFFSACIVGFSHQFFNGRYLLRQRFPHCLQAAQTVFFGMRRLKLQPLGQKAVAEFRCAPRALCRGHGQPDAVSGVVLSVQEAFPAGQIRCPVAFLRDRASLHDANALGHGVPDGVAVHVKDLGPLACEPDHGVRAAQPEDPGQRQKPVDGHADQLAVKDGLSAHGQEHPSDREAVVQLRLVKSHVVPRPIQPAGPVASEVGFIGGRQVERGNNGSPPLDDGDPFQQDGLFFQGVRDLPVQEDFIKIHHLLSRFQ